MVTAILSSETDQQGSRHCSDKQMQVQKQITNGINKFVAGNERIMHGMNNVKVNERTKMKLLCVYASQGQARVSCCGLFYLTLHELMLQNLEGHPFMQDLATGKASL